MRVRSFPARTATVLAALALVLLALVVAGCSREEDSSVEADFVFDAAAGEVRVVAPEELELEEPGEPQP